MTQYDININDFDNFDGKSNKKFNITDLDTDNMNLFHISYKNDILLFNKIQHYYSNNSHDYCINNNKIHFCEVFGY
jgi:hypothetical protein